MDSFKFNFGEKALNSRSEEANSVQVKFCNSVNTGSSIVNITDRHIQAAGCCPVQCLKLGPVEIRCIDSYDDIQKQLAVLNSTISSALTSHSDLVPGVYEGGLKIWECSIDLVNYLSENVDFDASMNVLELGCGAGIPGIFAHIKGSSCVVFQDFNVEVLDLVTVPNVLLNSKNQASGCYFVAGDWSVVGPNISHFANRFDVILTSETIYNPSSQLKLFQLFKEFLKPNGCVYLSAKSCYFGVGGSIWQFEELVKQEGTFDVKTCTTLEGGVKRMILKLNFKEDST